MVLEIFVGLIFVAAHSQTISHCESFDQHLYSKGIAYTQPEQHKTIVASVQAETHLHDNVQQIQTRQLSSHGLFSRHFKTGWSHLQVYNV